ncbi:hypothetical protein F4553_001847 [Allocatelliglobosispora scoriae]|uniref:Uncharacterized protein n=1 Tax=Allocatelliglobosispora scoriae TaxID=643052 RepID=A0A841BM82_9ACTN|nr:hypothetical protein [Allocatelliglobosispora scoriae]MBB5868468.1 hypothetical protein [Allocatelliglobosispora scoriae]
MRTHRRLLLALIAAATLVVSGTNAYDETPAPCALPAAHGRSRG